MDEREGWRPRIFYSQGPNKGLLEPFPEPTHLRRKERSTFNRGLLYSPNARDSTAEDGEGRGRGLRRSEMGMEETMGMGMSFVKGRRLHLDNVPSSYSMGMGMPIESFGGGDGRRRERDGMGMRRMNR